ncbi:hypothetical protein GLYMA_03G038900v4 [Glycine max]|uniref:Protein kinase domain-containing protein n=1 Tax=Glycine max TaxID=3847 RepID=K7KCQ7_SOYBN|nr:hypothetical protein GLYMA_03G038900v4 [Glycine max]KRH65478.1 hypothetical protein GLYMA_03G038900v4 [Glycine max]
MEQKGGVLMQRYELGRLLGQGTFGKVYHARNIITGMSVAIKITDKEKILKVGMIDQIKRESSNCTRCTQVAVENLGFKPKDKDINGQNHGKFLVQKVVREAYHYSERRPRTGSSGCIICEKIVLVCEKISSL